LLFLVSPLGNLLEQTGWVIKGPKGAAARLGMSPATLRRRIAKLGILRDQGFVSAPGFQRDPGS
jgi:hypothetical protein